MKLNRFTAKALRCPVKVIQFGEGNFLRAFVDWIIWKTNQNTDFNAGVVVVQPIDKGMVDVLNEQEGLYHVNLQGLDKGEAVDSVEMVDVINGGLNPYSDFEGYLSLAENPDVRFVIHFDVPDSPEAYFQEAGRGGRDGKRSFAVMLWNSTDVRRMRQLETVSFPSLEYIEDIYHKVHIFYEIPYDTGAGRQLKFDLDAFCRHFHLQRQAAYYAMVYIERTGHWTLSEDVDISTKVQIIVDRNELYDIELPDSRMELILDLLMRRCTGLFSYPVPIDEEYVAGILDVQVEGVLCESGVTIEDWENDDELLDFD